MRTLLELFGIALLIAADVFGQTFPLSAYQHTHQGVSDYNGPFVNTPPRPCSDHTAGGTITGNDSNVWMTMDWAVLPGRPIWWRVVNDHHFLVAGKYFVAVDVSPSWPWPLIPPATSCWAVVPMQAQFYPRQTHGMGRFTIKSPFSIPYSAPRGWTFYSTLVGWEWDSSRNEFSRIFMSNTVRAVVQ